jgi:hypothetical protein
MRGTIPSLLCNLSRPETHRSQDGPSDVLKGADSPPIPAAVPLLDAISGEEFTFVINNTPFSTSVIEAVVLSPAVRD